jgi:hypothetical protein
MTGVQFLRSVLVSRVQGACFRGAFVWVKARRRSSLSESSTAASKTLIGDQGWRAKCRGSAPEK